MFFTRLNELMQDDQTINLNLLKKGGRIHVCVMPKVRNMAAAAAGKLIPLSLSGTPAELDQGFFTAICEPIKERFGLISNTEAFRENTKSATAKKPQNSNQGVGAGSDGKQSKNEKKIAEAVAHEKAGRWPEAYAIYKKISEAEPGNQTMKEKVREVWEKMAQRPLFGPPAEELSVEEPELVQEEELDDEMISEEEEETDDDDTTDGDIPDPAADDKAIADKQPVDMFAQLMGMANSI